jgi:CRP-like cAMP-binding protein
MARSERPANRLLAAVPVSEYDRLHPHLESVGLPARAVLHEAGQAVAHVYFPVDGVISLLAPAEEGFIEVAVVGREGVVGLAAFLGAEAAATQSLVQVPGQALRMPAEVFQSAISRDARLHGLLLRFTHVLLTQVSQSVACNSLHPILKRLCRWLLMIHARAGADRFPLSHEFVAAMLGVRRASVTEAAQELQQAGLIRYSRGLMMVLDREGLEAVSCGCHRVTQAELSRLPGPDGRKGEQTRR